MASESSKYDPKIGNLEKQLIGVTIQKETLDAIYGFLKNKNPKNEKEAFQYYAGIMKVIHESNKGTNNYINNQ